MNVTQTYVATNNASVDIKRSLLVTRLLPRALVKSNSIHLEFTHYRIQLDAQQSHWRSQGVGQSRQLRPLGLFAKQFDCAFHATNSS
jgi:hypothetical protein